MAQTYQDFEIVFVVDGGSTDGSKEIFDSFNNLERDNVVILRTPHLNAAEARNIGLNRASGSIVVFLDADDKIAPDYLEKTVPLMADGIDIVCADIQTFGSDSLILESKLSTPDANNMPVSSLVRKEAALRVNGYDSTMMWDDWDFWLRLLNSGSKVAFLHEALFYYRHGINKASRKINLKGEEANNQIWYRHAYQTAEKNGRFLIAVKSYGFDHERGTHDLIRETWGKDLPANVDLKFFTGRTGEIPDSDEVIVEALDNYVSLPYKVRRIIRWALSHGYQNIFMCDTGSFIIPHHLMGYWGSLDYFGYWGMKIKTFPYVAEDVLRDCPRVEIKQCYPWASGGGYGLSEKAMLVMAQNEPVVHAEDLNTAQLLAKNDIFLTDLAPKGYRGYVCDWISGEKNDEPHAFEKRREWMLGQYNTAKDRCAKDCTWTEWMAANAFTELRDPDNIEYILAQRKKARQK